MAALDPIKIQQAILTRIEGMESTAGQQEDKHQAEVDRIEAEQLRLIQAHGAGAVPLKHLIGEQERLRAALRSAEAALRSTQLKFDDIRRTFGQALTLARDCYEAYKRATPVVRRMFDQLFFERLLVTESEVSGAVLARPFADLLANDLLGELSNPQKAKTAPVALLSDLEDSWDQLPRSRTPTRFCFFRPGSERG